MSLKNKTAKALYSELRVVREPYLTRARDAAELTIPSLMPPDGLRGGDLPNPWQSLGAMGVNNLAAKLLLALMPPNTPFFKFLASDAIEAAFKAAGPDAHAQIEQTMSQLEGKVMTEIEQTADRVAVFEAFKQLVIAGNVLLFLPPSGTARVYKLDQFVVERDPRGNLLRAVIKEMISPLALPPELREAAAREAKEDQREDGAVEIYTCVERMNRDTYLYWQEVCEEKVQSTVSTVPAEYLPFLPLRWARIDGEDYGRGFIEEHIGDLQSADDLQKAIVQGSAAAARLVFLRNPNSALQAKEFTDAENGDVVDGMKDDIHATTLDKYADFKVAMDTASKLEQRLARAFLMVSSIQRDAERVTAEEIRTMATELEDALGGVYSTLSLEFQLPYVKRKLQLMQLQGKFPALPKGSIRPTIVTGMSALGRSHEVIKILQWGKACSEMLTPQVFAQRVSAERLMKKFGIEMSVVVDDIVKTDQEVQQEAAAQMKQERFNALAPAVVQAGAKQQ